jgi:hypothetical protein
MHVGADAARKRDDLRTESPIASVLVRTTLDFCRGRTMARALCANSGLVHRSKKANTRLISSAMTHI